MKEYLIAKVKNLLGSSMILDGLNASLNILVYYCLQNSDAKRRRMNRAKGISVVGLCVFTYDESQTTRNDLLLLILLLDLMNLWRFT